MNQKPVGSVTIQIAESITGKFRAKITVEADGWGAWKGQVGAADTQLEALEFAVDKIRLAGSRHNRGRRPSGFRSVVSFRERRGKAYEPRKHRNSTTTRRL